MSNELPQGVPKRCETDGCHRDTAYRFTTDTDKDGNVLSDTKQRAFCGPCKRAAEWIQSWHLGNYSFRRVDR